LPRLAWTALLLFILPSVAGMTGAHHHAQLFSVEIGSHEHFCQGWPETMILPNSTSHVAGITAMFTSALLKNFSNYRRHK
jgi:hypothetical protein